MHIVARAPNHLGDGVMALPALAALARLGRLDIAAPRWGAQLYRDLDAAVVPTGDLGAPDAAVLFPPSFRVAWQARRAGMRVGTATDARSLLLTHTVEQGPHRSDTYTRLARVVGAEPVGQPRYELRAGDGGPSVPDGHIGLNPVSVSGATVQWPGYRALADRLAAAHPVLFYGGPGEDARVAGISGPHARQVGLPLPAFAAALTRCAVFVSNDSGAAHFARAVGVPTVVVYGSTAPEQTGPAGSVPVLGPRPRCAPCYSKRCGTAFECLDIAVDAVYARVLEVLVG